MRKVGKEKFVLLLSVTVFLSYLPESGEYASFFVYLRLVERIFLLVLIVMKVIIEVIMKVIICHVS